MSPAGQNCPFPHTENNHQGNRDRLLLSWKYFKTTGQKYILLWNRAKQVPHTNHPGQAVNHDIRRNADIPFGDCVCTWETLEGPQGQGKGACHQASRFPRMKIPKYKCLCCSRPCTAHGTVALWSWSYTHKPVGDSRRWLKAGAPWYLLGRAHQPRREANRSPWQLMASVPSIPKEGLPAVPWWIPTQGGLPVPRAHGPRAVTASGGHSILSSSCTQLSIKQ